MEPLISPEKMAPLVREWWTATTRLEDVGAGYAAIARAVRDIVPEGTDVEDLESAIDILEVLVEELEEEGALEDSDMDEFVDACDDIEDFIDEATGGIYHIGVHPDETGTGGVWFIGDVMLDDDADEDMDFIDGDGFDAESDTDVEDAGGSTDLTMAQGED